MIRHPAKWLLIGTATLLVLAACADDGGGGPSDAADGSSRDASSDAQDADDAADRLDAIDTEPQPAPLVAVTFNTGTGPELAHDAGPDDGYGSDEAALSDEWYGNGLAWPPFIDQTRAWFDEVDADLVVFQEIFWSGACPGIPETAREGFVCEGWQPGDPTVVQALLGDGWQVACHPGRPDKCAAVNRRVGSFRGCDEDFCLEGLTGYRVEGCGSGARVARGLIDLVDGGNLTLVSLHGTSGGSLDERKCRLAQVEQVFVDLGDGEPGANGERNLIMGDFNTDPGRLASSDQSAERWNDFAGDGERFHFVTDVGRQAAPTYLGFANIDHVVSDGLDGDCWAAGVTPERRPVLDAVFFDHAPIVCELRAAE